VTGKLQTWVVLLGQRDSESEECPFELVALRGLVPQRQVQHHQRDSAAPWFVAVLGQRGLTAALTVPFGQMETVYFARAAGRKASCWSVIAGRTEEHLEVPVQLAQRGSVQTPVSQTHPLAASGRLSLPDQTLILVPELRTDQTRV
jgi:hypothetical protein